MSNRHRTCAIEMMEPSYHYRCARHHQRRVKSPPKRAIQKSVAWQEREPRKPRIPIPSWTPPARAIPSVHEVQLRRGHIGFRQILGPQAAPPVQVIALSDRFLVELRWFDVRTARI